MTEAGAIVGVFNKKSIQKQPHRYRIEAILSDGQWWTPKKIAKLATMTVPQVQKVLDVMLEENEVVASKDFASYRWDYVHMEKWFNQQSFNIGDQVFTEIFPARVWNNLSETEVIEQHPRRIISYAVFNSSSDIATNVKKRLQGIGVVESLTGDRYRVYSIYPERVKDIITEEANKLGLEAPKVYLRRDVSRRSVYDFPQGFYHQLVSFCIEFVKIIIANRGYMETISIFLDTSEDVESQVLEWVVTALEKFDESKAVPFTGYLANVIGYWVYDLPSMFLGKELAQFQRDKSKAIKHLEATYPERFSFTDEEISLEAGYTKDLYQDLDNKHSVWLRDKFATDTEWSDNNEEKASLGSVFSVSGKTDVNDFSSSSTDIKLANRITQAAVEAVIDTRQYKDFFTIVRANPYTIGSSRLALSPEFLTAFKEYFFGKTLELDNSFSDVAQEDDYQEPDNGE